MPNSISERDKPEGFVSYYTVPGNSNAFNNQYAALWCISAFYNLKIFSLMVDEQIGNDFILKLRL